MYKKISEELIDFIKNSPTAFHAIDNISKRLKENGYEELLEGRRWNIKAGGKYFVTRNNSSIIALNIGTKLDNYSFNVAASHIGNKCEKCYNACYREKGQNIKHK